MLEGYPERRRIGPLIWVVGGVGSENVYLLYSPLNMSHSVYTKRHNNDNEPLCFSLVLSFSG